MKKLQYLLESDRSRQFYNIVFFVWRSLEKLRFNCWKERSYDFVCPPLSSKLHASKPKSRQRCLRVLIRTHASSMPDSLILLHAASMSDLLHPSPRCCHHGWISFMLPVCLIHLHACHHASFTSMLSSCLIHLYAVRISGSCHPYAYLALCWHHACMLGTLILLTALCPFEIETFFTSLCLCVLHTCSEYVFN